MNNGLAVNLICDESYLLLFQGLVDESSSDNDDDFFLVAAQIMHSYWYSVNTSKHGGYVMGHEVVDRNRET